MLGKYRVIVNCRRPGEWASEVVKVACEVVATDAEAARIKAKERCERDGFVVGLIGLAVYLKVATVADELRDAGVPSLFDLAVA